MLAFFVLSYIVIVYQIVGIILGQRRSRKLEELLPALLDRHYDVPRLTLDQWTVPTWRSLGDLRAWHATLPWEERLRRVWRCAGILVIAAWGGAIGVVLGNAYFATSTGHARVGIALAVWLGIAGFWGAPALYHLSAASWFIHRLSSQSVKTAFITSTTSGMNWVGRLAFEYLMLYSGAAALWTIVALVAFGGGVATMLFSGVMSLFALVGFALPQLSIRWAMVRRKRDMLDEILRRLQSEHHPNIIAHPGPEPSRLMGLYTFVLAVPPSGMFGATATSVGAALVPVWLALLRAASEKFADSATLEILVHYLR